MLDQFRAVDIGDQNRCHEWLVNLLHQGERLVAVGTDHNPPSLATLVGGLGDLHWFDGSAMYPILTFPNFSVYDMSWLRNFPWLINIATYGTVATELSFAFLVWRKGTRPIALLAVIGMHVGIMLLMNVQYFSEIMLTTFVLFLDAAEYAWLEKHVVLPLAAWFRSRFVARTQLKGAGEAA